MKPSVVAAALRIAESTLRKYASEYGEFLSPGAKGGAGQHRDFSDLDIRVLKLIADMRSADSSSADIDVTLQSLKAGNWERLPLLDDKTSNIVPTPGALIAAQKDYAVMQREIELLREQVVKLDAKLDAERADRDELLARLHRAEQLVELYEQGRLSAPPKSP